MVDSLAVDARELLEQLALTRGEAPRGLDHHLHELVAASIAVQIGKALALETEDLARLRAGLDLQLDLAVERRHFDLGAERGRRKAYRHFDDYVVVLAHEEIVLLDVDHDIEAARRTAAPSGLALAAQLQARSIVDPRRDHYRERLGTPDASLALALGAGVGDDRAFAAALAAGGGDGKEALLGADLPGAAAVGASADAFAAAAGTAARAGVAGCQALKLDHLLGATRRFLEFDFEVVAQIVAAPRTRARAPAAGAEEVAEDVREDLFEALGKLEAEAVALLTLERGVAVAVVLRAALSVGEHLVGLVEFLE